MAAIRNLFSKAGGSIGEPNSVGWMFSQKGVIRVAVKGDAEELALSLLDVVDVGADGDISVDGGEVQVTLAPTLLEPARQSIEKAGHKISSAEVTMIPSNTVPLDEKQAEAVLKLLDLLEDHDDVQEVHANAEIPDSVLESV